MILFSIGFILIFGYILNNYKKCCVELEEIKRKNQVLESKNMHDTFFKDPKNLKRYRLKIIYDGGKILLTDSPEMHKEDAIYYMYPKTSLSLCNDMKRNIITMLPPYRIQINNNATTYIIDKIEQIDIIEV